MSVWYESSNTKIFDNGDGKRAVATLERGEAARNPKGNAGRRLPSKRGVATARFPSPGPSPNAALPHFEGHAAT
jgi:hypothetical protein